MIGYAPDLSKKPADICPLIITFSLIQRTENGCHKSGGTVMGSMSTVMVGNSVDIMATLGQPLERPFQRLLHPDAWKVMGYQGGSSLLSFDARTVFLRDEWRLSGEAFLARATSVVQRLGQRDAQKLAQTRNIIPSRFEGARLIFPRTWWEHPELGVCVPALVPCGKGVWKFTFALAGVEWASSDLVAVGDSPSMRGGDPHPGAPSARHTSPPPSRQGNYGEGLTLTTTQ